ncbi:MAG: hypothetical protein E7H57_04710 [Pantoea sp.]|nr:hypothetical protein [Pantoea sp.]
MPEIVKPNTVLDKLIDMERKTILFVYARYNIIASLITSILFSVSAFYIEDKTCLVFFVALLIFWERVLILKIDALKSQRSD